MSQEESESDGGTLSYLCTSCGTRNSNGESVEDGLYKRGECVECGHIEYEETMKKQALDMDEGNPSETNIFNNDELMSDVEEKKENLERAKAGIEVVDETSEKGTCARPNCDNTHDLARKTYDDGSKSGLLCGDCRGGE